MTNSNLSLVGQWTSLAYSNLSDVQNATRAQQMAAYMKGNFTFLGVSKPLRAEIQRPLWASRPRKAAAIGAIQHLWNQPCREAQYLACDLLKSESKHWQPDEALPALEQWITSKSWWDSVDALAVHGVGVLLSKHPELVWPKVQQWIDHENLWLNRTALICQLGYREKTRTEWLDEALSAHTRSTEFFHRKAIGWALRDYAKTNSRWVVQWVNAHPELSGLSRREALRLLDTRAGA